MLKAPFEQVEGRACVLAHGTRRVLARTRGIRNPGEMEDRVAAGDQLASRGISRVDADGVFRFRALGAAGP